MTPAAQTPCVIYVRVSTKEQGVSGLGLEAQEAACRQEAERRGWQIVEFIPEVVSGEKSARPMFARACELAAGHQGVLLSSKADRVSRGTVASVIALHEQAANQGWKVYTLDMPEIDTTSPMGEFILTIMAAMSRLERRLISMRTSDAMKAKAKRGEPVGRPRTIPDVVISRMVAYRRAGLSLQKMAEALNADGITSAMGPYPKGKTPRAWAKQNVAMACKRYEVTG